MNHVHVLHTQGGPVLITRLGAEVCESLGLPSETLTVTRLMAGWYHQNFVVVVETTYDRKKVFDLCRLNLMMSEYSAEEVTAFIYATDPIRAALEK